MPLTIGTRLGPYEILSAIGAGGMGEVYRARDTRLNRDVALKVLPEAFARDSQRMGRFDREAKVLASLNHPNIAAIYGIEESGPITALVMELVEGPTLADRIRSGAIPLDEALPIAKQVADAVEYAHDKNVIHRDLKPANIKVKEDGTVKVLDFGLAKALSDDPTEGDMSNSPTLSMAATRAGVILGTAAYMSPEQAKGKVVDRRADVWAFGAVLYEMLTGKQAFGGETVPETMAAVMNAEPALDRLPAKTPSAIRDLLRRCLTKDLRRRLPHIGESRMVIEDVLSGATPAEPVVAGRVHTRVWVAVCLLSVGVASFTVWKLKPSSPNAPQRAARFLLPMPADFQLKDVRMSLETSIAVSPDGSRLAFVAVRGGKAQLYLRNIEETDTKALQGTEDATAPFFSPDGEWIGFFAQGKLKKIPTNGGLPVALCDAPSARGGNWSEKGFIVFSPQARGTGIFQVSADGGTAKPISILDISKGETSHRMPEVLPGGNTVLFTAYGATYQDVSVAAVSLKTGERRDLIEGASFPHYALTGHLLYLQPKLPGTIMAVAFDPESLKLGTAVPVLEGVLTNRGDSAQWTVSRSGLLIYAPGGLQEPVSNLVWVDRKGVAEQVGTPAKRPYAFPRLSPDGRKILVSLEGIQDSLWIFDLASKTFTRMTIEGNNSWPLWTPDGKRITYASNRAAPWRVFWKLADGSSKEELLLDEPYQQPYSWSADGKLLAYLKDSPSTTQDIWVVSIDGERRSQPFAQTPAAEVDASFSPDSRWIAYASNESGNFEIYVQPFPPRGGKWQISTDGGREPEWAHGGRELFYRNGDRMMVVNVTTQPVFQPSSPRILFQGPYELSNTVSPDYGITADGQRFLMVQPSEATGPITGFNVVINWFEELKTRVPTGTK